MTNKKRKGGSKKRATRRLTTALHLVRVASDDVVGLAKMYARNGFLHPTLENVRVALSTAAKLLALEAGDVG